MDESTVIDLSRETIMTAIKIVTPILIVGMTVGIMVSLFQTITSLQEQTLTLVPKMLSMALTIMILLPYILETLLDFGTGLFTNLAAFAGLEN